MGAEKAPEPESLTHWCRRLVDTLVALVLGKFVIVSVLSLSAGALAGGTGSAPSGAGPGDGTGGGFGAMPAARRCSCWPPCPRGRCSGCSRSWRRVR